MNRFFARWAALGSTAAALAFTSAGAFAQATFTLNDPNCSDFTFGGTPGNRTLTCVPNSGPPANPPTCTISGPGTGTIGTPINLTANCGPGPITAGSYVWTGGTGNNCGAATGSTCSDSGSTAGAAGGVVNYTVSASNAAGASLSPSPPKAVTWSPSGGGGGGGGGGGSGPFSCPGFPNTVTINMDWTTPVRKTTNGFHYNDALVVHFKTGSVILTRKGNIALAEYNSPPAEMHSTLSTSPCDFGTGLGVVDSNSVTQFFTVGGTVGPVLNINTDYYLNVYMVAPSSCQGTPNGDCGRAVDLTKPRP